MIDIHTHITPNVDDGSISLEMSLDMLRSIVDQGGTKVFLTPHSDFFSRYSFKRIFRQMERVREEAAAERIPLQIYQGCEIFSYPKIMDKILQFLENGFLPSMNHTRYIMAEFSMWDGDLEEAMFCLQRYLDEGWIPIIAHAERYCGTFTTVENIQMLKDMGCLVQTNLFDLDQESDYEIRDCARELLKAELIDMVGSDAHQMGHRKPELERGTRYILNHCRKDYAEAILWKNAEKMLCE